MSYTLDARFTLVTAPTEEPLTVDDVAEHCQIGDVPTDQWRVLANYITTARQVLERRLRRQFCAATWKLYMDSLPDEIWITDKLPIKTVTHIKYYDTDGTLTTLTPAATYYQTDLTSTGRPARIIPAYGVSWPSVRSDTLNAVEVQFTCGYGTASDVPACIKNGMLLLIANWFEHREQVVIGTIATQLPWGVDACISPEDWGAYS
jgi:uncharacterized phiE125 gp8 family phage protein